jgi:hypothetical protein
LWRVRRVRKGRGRLWERVIVYGVHVCVFISQGCVPVSVVSKSFGTPRNRHNTTQYTRSPHATLAVHTQHLFFGAVGKHHLSHRCTITMEGPNDFVPSCVACVLLVCCLCVACVLLVCCVWARVSASCPAFDCFQRVFHVETQKKKKSTRSYNT